MDLQTEIRGIVEEKLSQDQFLVEVLISSKKGPSKVLILVDGDKGFSIEDCAELSRHVAKILDERNLIESNYLLEVSTPGVDHPLKLKRQYLKNVGRLLKVKLADTTLEGRLTQASDEKILLSQEIGSGKKKETKEVEIPFSDIEKAFVMVSFK
jgi:ribosome maturation factor RimP